MRREILEAEFRHVVAEKRAEVRRDRVYGGRLDWRYWQRERVSHNTFQSLALAGLLSVEDCPARRLLMTSVVLIPLGGCGQEWRTEQLRAEARRNEQIGLVRKAGKAQASPGAGQRSGG